MRTNGVMPGVVKFAVKGQGAYAPAKVALPLAATVVLEAPMATEGQCAQLDFAGPPPAPSCGFNTSGNTLRCR